MNDVVPYLIRAYCDWMEDSDLTPYILVDCEKTGIIVPAGFAKEGKIILNIVKTNNKINAVSFVIKDSTQYLTWIDMFDNSKMINIFNYISLITVLSSEDSVIINFGRGVYRYKILNFIPQSKDLFSLQINYRLGSVYVHLLPHELD